MFCGYRISLLLRMPRHIMPCSTREEIYLGIPLIISIFRLSQWFVFFLKTINVPPPKKNIYISGPAKQQKPQQRMVQEEVTIVPTLFRTDTGLDEQGPVLENEKRKKPPGRGGVFLGGPL